MFKTLKSKFFIVYLCLVVITAIVGFTSALDGYKLGRSINGLMIDNYKSINAANKMRYFEANDDSEILDQYEQVDRDNEVLKYDGIRYFRSSCIEEKSSKEPFLLHLIRGIKMPNQNLHLFWGEIF